MADEELEDAVIGGDEPNFGDDDAIVDLGDDDLDIVEPDDNLGFSLGIEREFEE